MTRDRLLDLHWREFLLWCATFDDSLPDSHLVFWLDHNAPCEENFWEWLVKYRAEVLKEDKDGQKQNAKSGRTTRKGQN